MFQGYTQETVEFLWGIRLNNERAWFTAHKDTYTQQLLRPTQALAEQVYDALHAAFPDEPLFCHVSRIYRDARRLHGRPPYKESLWFNIDDSEGAPSFWFEIAGDFYAYGLGLWEPKASVMEAYRRRADRDPQALEKLVRRLDKDGRFSLHGQSYARAKAAPTIALQEWYNKKTLYVSREVAPLDERVFTPALAEDITDGFCFLMPLYRYFRTILSEMPHGK